jgi:kynurenine formamidase
MQGGWLEQFYHRVTAEPKVEEPEVVRAPEVPAEVSRRDFIQTGLVTGVTASMAAGSVLAQTQVAQAQATGDTPIGPKWWPSRWGPQDEAGASNWITPAKVLEAARLIKTGKIYEMGRVYQSEQPAFGARVFALRILGSPANADTPFGKNKLMYHDDFVVTELGQTGTQFDGLGHIGCETGKRGDLSETRWYNGVTELEMYNMYGLTKLGIEKIKPIFTRGVLVDVVAFKGRNLNLGEAIKPADLTGALQRQNISEASFKPGDAIFFRTGWSEEHWIKNNAKYNEGCPGIGLDVAKWIAQKQLCVAGSDTWPVEVVPGENPDLPFVCHQELITKNGIFLHENMDLSELGKDRVYEFVYVFAPMRIKGATGSPGRPIAIV